MSKRVDRTRHERPRARRRVRATRAAVPAAPATGGACSIDERLARLLETPHLVQVVRHLPTETLHQLIEYRGLEASGEILAAASSEQVSSLLDVDLWRPAEPASDERFDPDRFGDWLEALLETGESLAARIVSGIEERLVTAGLSGHIRVFDPAARVPSWSQDEPLDRDHARPAGLATEVGGYLIAAKRPDAWDAIVALLLSLEADHRAYFDAVMRGCRRLSNSIPEADAFHDLLTEPAQLLHDLGLARQVRRSQLGYLPPADARMILQVARQPLRDAGDPSCPLRLVAARYLEPEGESGTMTRSDGRRQERDAPPPAKEDPAPPAKDASAPSAKEDAPPPKVPEIDDSIRAVVDLLAEAGVAPDRPRALLAAKTDRPGGVERVRGLLEHLHHADEYAYEARSREIAFLANALMAGCSLQARPFTAQEASDGAVAVCTLGLEEWQLREDEGRTLGPSGEERALPEMFLADHDLLSVFQLGWAALHAMSVSVADRLVAVLEDLRCADVETQLGLHMLQRELVKQRRAGTPWRARDALDVIAVLDMPAWVSLLGVLDECPVVPAALTATLERSAGAVSATAFEFISTRAQIGQVGAFMARLVDILVGS